MTILSPLISNLCKHHHISIPLVITFVTLISCDGPKPLQDRQKSIDYSPLLSPSPEPDSQKTSSSGSVDIQTSESENDEIKSKCTTLYVNIARERDSSNKDIPSSASTAALVSTENPEIVKIRNQQLVSEINNFRSHGLNQEEVARIGSIVQLKEDQELQKAADIHLRDLALRKYFSHTSPEGCRLIHRVLLGTNFGAGRVGENLARGQVDAAQARQDWQDSPGHRLNMLGPHYTRIGVASGKGNNGELIWVAVFGARATDLPLPPSNIGSPASVGGSTFPPDNDSAPTPTQVPVSPPRQDSPPSLSQDLRKVSCNPPFATVWAGVDTNRFAYCKNGNHASGPTTKEMRKLCTHWGGGASACASNVWTENMYLSARGALYCPRGSRLEVASNSCRE